MNDLKLRALLTLLLLTLATLAYSQEPVPVLSVVDGDTIRVQLNGSSVPVRLIGIDTPETVHPFKPVEPFGPEASAFLKSTVLGHSVIIEPGERERDRYGRLLAYVFLPDGTHVNLKMLEAGLAYMLTIPPTVRYVTLYRAASQGAASVNKGLWRQYAAPFRDRNCFSFSTRKEAAAFFRGAKPGDPHRLDRDRDGKPCERLR